MKVDVMHVYKRGEHVMNSKIINLRIHVRTHLFVKVCDDDCRFTVLQQYGLICRAREHEWVKEIMYVFHSVHALGCLAVPNYCGSLHSEPLHWTKYSTTDLWFLRTTLLISILSTRNSPACVQYNKANSNHLFVFFKLDQFLNIWIFIHYKVSINVCGYYNGECMHINLPATWSCCIDWVLPTTYPWAGAAQSQCILCTRLCLPASLNESRKDVVLFIC